MKHSEEFVKLVDDAKTRVHEVTPQEAQAMRAEHPTVRLVDVREESEWAKGHAAEAEHISKGTIERDAEKLVPEKGTPLILYCGGGSRSALAADNLQKMGYTNVHSMKGGWRGWKEAGLPVEE